jgi:hypothetical protein
VENHETECLLCGQLIDTPPAFVKAVKSLLADIEDMQAGNWFGGFSEYTEDYDEFLVTVEWPNLAISAQRVRDSLQLLYVEEPEHE